MVKMLVLAMFTYRYTEKLRFYFEDFIETVIAYCSVFYKYLKEKQNLLQNIILYKQEKMYLALDIIHTLY